MHRDRPATGVEPEAATPAPTRLQTLWPWLFALAAFALVTGPVFSPDLQLSYRDTARLYYPVKQFISARLRAGELPLWDPWIEGGVSLLGQLSPGLFHPLTLLYLLLPFDLAFKLNHLLTLPLAGLGTFLLARRLGAGREAALVGAVVYAGSGYLLSVAGSNLPYAVGAAMVPFGLAGLLWFLERPSRRRLLAAAAGLASCAWGGEPQSMFLSGVIGGAWVSARGLLGGPAADLAARARQTARGLGLVALWSACALALAAPALVPAITQLQQGERLAGLSREEQGTFFNHPARLLGLLLPKVFDDDADIEVGPERHADIYRYVSVGTTAAFADSITLGAPALLLAACALWAGRRGQFLLLGASLFALASTGQALGFEALLAHLPGFGLFRYAEKLIGPCSLLFALAAALGTEEAFGRGPARVRRFAAIAAGSAAGLLLFPALLAVARGPLETWLRSLLPGGHPDLPRTMVEALEGGFLSSALATGLLALAAVLSSRRNSARLGHLVAASVCTAVSLIWSSSLLWTVPVGLLREPPPLAQRLLAKAGPSPGRWRVQVTYSGSLPHPPTEDVHRASIEAVVRALQPQATALFGLESLSSYFSLEDSRWDLLLRAAPGSLLPLFDTRFLVIMPHDLTPARALRLGYSADEDGFWLQEHSSSPRAFLVGAARVAPDIAGLGKALAAPAFRPFEEVAVLPPDAAQVAGLDRPAQAGGPLPRWSRPSPERVEIALDATADGILVFSEHHDPGWRAQVDGKAAPVLAVDGLLLGVRVGAGPHRVLLRFSPPGLGAAFAICAAVIAGLGIRPRRVPR